MMSRIVPSIARPQLVLVLGHKRYATKTSSSYQNALLRFRGRRGFTRHLQLSFQTDSMSVGSADQAEPHRRRNVVPQVRRVHCLA
jgi:hypothetical protein